MEIKDMQMSDIEARKAEIRELVPEATETEIAELNAELDQLEERAAEIKAAVENRNKIVDRLKSGEGVKMEMKIDEPAVKIDRNSPEYIRAFENYVRTGDATECRSLLSENATNGTVAVPEFVYDIVKTAWEKNEIMSLIRKVEVQGNLKVNFERIAGEATAHAEGGAAVAEENLQLGIVTLIPTMFKKWIGVSREVYSLRGEAFLRYIYDELAHKIVKKIGDNLIEQIIELPETATTTVVAAGNVIGAPSLGIIAQAISKLSDEAANPVIVMNKATWAAFKAAQYEGNFAADPFEGLPVVFNNTLQAYTSSGSGDDEESYVYAIVGDFGNGALANLPNGNDVTFIFDEFTQKKADMIEVMGEQFAAVAPIASDAFVRITNV